jgi:hypothetical protein
MAAETVVRENRSDLVFEEFWSACVHRLCGKRLNRGNEERQYNSEFVEAHKPGASKCQAEKETQTLRRAGRTWAKTIINRAFL